MEHASSSICTFNPGAVSCNPRSSNSMNANHEQYKDTLSIQLYFSNLTTQLHTSQPLPKAARMCDKKPKSRQRILNENCISAFAKSKNSAGTLFPASSAPLSENVIPLVHQSTKSPKEKDLPSIEMYFNRLKTQLYASQATTETAALRERKPLIKMKNTKISQKENYDHSSAIMSTKFLATVKREPLECQAVSVFSVYTESLHENAVQTSPNFSLPGKNCSQTHNENSSISVDPSTKYLVPPQQQIVDSDTLSENRSQFKWYSSPRKENHGEQDKCMSSTQVPLLKIPRPKTEIGEGSLLPVDSEKFSESLSEVENIYSETAAVTSQTIQGLKLKSDASGALYQNNVDVKPYSCVELRDVIQTAPRTLGTVDSTIANAEEKTIGKFKRHDGITQACKKINRCDECGGVYNTKAYLSDHKHIHTGELPYQCIECGKAFAFKTGLQSHLVTHDQKKPFSCVLCGKAFKRKTVLMNHQRQHTDEKPFHCDECGKDFKNNNTLICHARLHTGEKPYHCDDCGKDFEQSGSLRSHQRTHTGETPYKCATCGKVFKHKCNLVYHERSHSGEKPYLCQECGKSFAHRTALVLHKRVHAETKPHSCHFCGKVFKSNSALTSHIRKHTGEKPYSCFKCGKQFKHQSNLVYHSRSHTGENKHSCNLCGKNFQQKCNFMSHLRQHTGETPYKCTVCSKAFKNKSNLIYHARLHSGETPYQCDICSKSFKQNCNLVSHQRQHSGDTPYQCSKCSKCFKTKYSLIYHSRSHTGEKPYQCNDCGKAFKQKCNLVSHQRQHTGEEPYHCEVCGKSYKNKPSLSYHLKMHTDENRKVVSYVKR